jgi:GT2 family glycosyltransferase
MKKERDVTLSVVIAAWNRPADLERCLTALHAQADTDAEIIVASNGDGAASRSVSDRFQNVRRINLPAGATVPELRARGLDCARGEVVALLEDSCAPDRNWTAEIKRAHSLPYAAIGGAIEIADGARPLDWAVYFFDYGKYMPPLQEGVSDSLSGLNVSYKRSVIGLAGKCFSAGFSETFIHEELKRQGQELYLSPSAIVQYKKTHSLKKSLTQFYHLARAFAGKRIVGATSLKRCAFALGSFALPILLPARITRGIIRKGRRLGPLFSALPRLILLMLSWSAGEFSGYLWGEGDSAGKWN